MKKPSWCEKHFKIRRAVSELQNLSSHFNRTALYCFVEIKSNCTAPPFQITGLRYQIICGVEPLICYFTRGPTLMINPNKSLGFDPMRPLGPRNVLKS